MLYWSQEKIKGGIPMSELGALVLAHIPALLMMITGFMLLVIEMYIPGFGIAGITGTALMVVGIVIMEPSPLQALILALICVILLGIAFSIAIHSISKGRLSRSKLVLNAALNREEPNESEDLSYFVGRVGKTHTALRPAGIAEIDGRRIDVITDGEFLPANTSVTVEQVQGLRVLVHRSAE